MYLVTAIYDRDPISLCKITPHISTGVPMALPAGYRNMQYYWSLPAPNHSDPDDCPSIDPEHPGARSAQTSCTAKPTSVILQIDRRNMSLCSLGPLFLWHPLHRTLLCPGTFRQLSCHPLAHDGIVSRWNLSARRGTVYAKFPDEVPKVHANLGKIKERLMDYGISGLTRHSLRKLAVTWGDGSARYFLRTGENDRVQPLTLLDSEQTDFMIVYCQAFFVLQQCCLLRSLLSKHGKRLEDPLFPVVLTVFGGIVFYLLWEAKAEYSIPFIPILLCLSADGVQAAQSFQHGAIPAKRVRQTMLMCLSVTIFLTLCAFSSFTVQPVTQKKILCKCSYRAFFTVYKYGANEHFNNLTDILCTSCV